MTLREEATLKVLKVVATLGKAISTGAIAAVGYYVPGIVGESFSLAHATRLLFFRGKTQKEESEFLLYSKKREKKGIDPVYEKTGPENHTPVFRVNLGCYCILWLLYTSSSYTSD